MADQLVTKMPLAQQLNDMVKNFTLLDILSKEEQEDLLSSKIDLIRKQNEERLRRHQEIEEDRLRAAGEDRGFRPVDPDTEELQQTSPSSPVPPRNTPSPQNRTSPQGARSQTPQNGSHSPCDTRSPHGMRDGPQYIIIQLRNEGKGLGFGLISRKGQGVVVKTIIPGGAAATDGRLQPDDMMVYVNDTYVKGFTRDQIVDLLIELQKQSKEVTLQVLRGAEQISSPPSSGRGSRHTGNVYPPSSDRKMEFTVVNDLVDVVPRRHVSEDVCGKTLNVEVDYKGQRRGPIDEQMPSKPAQNPGVNGWSYNSVITYYQNEEWSEKRKQNIDRVEAEIMAMREQYENQKQQGGSIPPPEFGHVSFLEDQSRSKRDSADRQHGSRRSQHSYGGRDFEDATSLIAKQKGHHKQQPPRNIDISMTGRERKRYESWKKERDEIDEQRVARHKNATGEWKREWDKNKAEKCQNERKPKPVKGRVLTSENKNDEPVPTSWGRGRGRGRGAPKIDQPFNNELKYSKISAIKKMNEGKQELPETTDSLSIPANVDSMHGTGESSNKGAEISTGKDLIVGEADLQLKNNCQSARDGNMMDADIPTGSDPKSRQPDLHIDIPDPEQGSTVTSPGTFKTPPGFKHVINWAEEMEKLDPVDEL